MSRLISLILILIPFAGFSQLWQETFEDLPNGAVSDRGPSAWISVQPTGVSPTFSKQYIGGLARNIFAINDTGNEGIWRSEEIDISSSPEVAIEVEMGCYWTSSTDYIKCYYKVDDGPEKLFGEQYGSTDLIITSAASAIVSGNKVQIIIKALENTGGFYGGSPRMMGFDNIRVSKITYLYSRSSGNWNGLNTWSEGGYNGASCSCTPDHNTHVFVGDRDIINLNISATAAGLTVENSGRINYTVNANLNIVRGGVLEIAENGTLDKNGNNNSSITFATDSYRVDTEGDLSVGHLNISGAMVNFSGNGSFSINGNLNITNSSGSAISNQMAGGLNIGANLYFSSGTANIIFVNAGVMSVGDRIVFDNDNIRMENTGTISAGSGIVVNDIGDSDNEISNAGILNVGHVDANGSNLVLKNSGTVNQTGDFLDVSGSTFYNLSGSTWNFGGTGTDVKLYTNEFPNKFNYNRSGDQTVFVPENGSYHQLEVSGSGRKAAAGDLSVSNSLELTSGELDINGNTLRILNPNTNAIARTSGYIKSETNTFPYGRVIWAVGNNTGSYVYPFGKSNAEHTPFIFDIQAAGSGAGSVSVATFATSDDNLPFPEGVTDLNQDGADNRENVVDRFWQIDLLDYDENPSVDVTFTATPEEVGAIAGLRAQRWNSSGWDAPLPGQTNPSPYSVTVPGVRQFSPWALSGNSSSLPVELAYFEAEPREDVVELKWRTHQELNNDFFVVEKTRDFKTFYEVALVPGGGTTQAGHEYHATDSSPFSGVSYYRLKQTDFDGKFEYFKPVVVEFKSSSSNLSLFPNPSNGRKVTLAGLDEGQAIEVFTSQGKLLYYTSGTSTGNQELVFGEPLDPGVYFLKVGADHIKMVVQ